MVGQATAAYFAKVNDEGGINGRMVTVVNVDDGLAPTQDSGTGAQDDRTGLEAPALDQQCVGPGATRAGAGGPGEHGGLDDHPGVTDPSDTTWHNDADYKAWLAWMKKYQPKGNVENSANASVYVSSAAIPQLLKAAGDDVSREKILKQMTQLKNFAAPMLLPGIMMTMSADNYNIFHKIQIMRFDGKRWVAQGKPVGE